MLITLDKLEKRYVVRKKVPGRAWKRERTVVEAIKDLSFTIDKGEIVGYIGPNGAGKSTTIKIMSGILAPDGGRCIIDGREPHRQRVEHVRHIGVVFGQRSSLWWDVPVLDSFNLLRDIYAIPSSTYKRSLDTVTELLQLQELLRTPTRQLSLGQRMRCEVAAALLHEPDLLFLDEPTIGLDAVSKLAVRDFIREINRMRGVTVLLTTHDMNDIEALATRVMLLGHGELLFDGKLETIREQMVGDKTLTVRFDGEETGEPLPGAQLLTAEKGRAVYRFDAAATSAQTLIAALSQKHQLRDISVTDPPLEQMMARFYKELHL